MAMIRCPECGERYSDTYRECPFCEEEEALRDGEEIRRSPRRGKRTAAHSRQYSLLTPTLIVLIFIMAGLLIYLLYGDKLAEKFDGENANNPTQEEVEPSGTPVENPDTQTPEEEDPSGVMPEDPSTTDDTPEDTTTAELEETDYEAAAKLPGGLSLSTTDFTLKTLGESHTIKASGGSSTYKWYSQDDGIASVDQNGKVTAVSNGTVNVLATDGSKKAICIVRVNASGSQTQTPPTNTGGSSSTLKAGAAVVVNGGNGVRVRSGPGTNYEVLATVPNGADIQVVESAGNGWYKITFSDVGGSTTSGYMKGEFLSNR